MTMQASCAQILGLTLLVNTNLGIVISFATPYWRENSYYVTGSNGGLWAECFNSNCDWFFDNDFRLQRMQPDWFKATQGLMSVGLGLGLLALLIATLSLCCTCHSCNLNVPIAVCLIVSCLSMGVGITIFGIKAKNDWDIDIEWKPGLKGRFGWSFWVGIGASALALLTGCMYGCMGRKQR